MLIGILLIHRYGHFEILKNRRIYNSAFDGNSNGFRSVTKFLQTSTRNIILIFNHYYIDINQHLAHKH